MRRTSVSWVLMLEGGICLGAEGAVRAEIVKWTVGSCRSPQRPRRCPRQDFPPRLYLMYLPLPSLLPSAVPPIFGHLTHSRVEGSFGSLAIVLRSC